MKVLSKLLGSGVHVGLPLLPYGVETLVHLLLHILTKLSKGGVPCVMHTLEVGVKITYRGAVVASVAENMKTLELYLLPCAHSVLQLASFVLPQLEERELVVFCESPCHSQKAYKAHVGLCTLL